jgi:hypothetical protein
MAESVRIEVPSGDVSGLSLGSIVTVQIRGKITSMNEAYEDKGQVELSVEGESTLNPGSLGDALIAAMAASNARGPVDYPTGQRELHAP